MTLDELLSRSPLATTDVPYFTSLVRYFISETRFDGQTVINPSTVLAPGQLGVFFSDFSQETWRPFALSCLHHRGSCETDIILCDVNFLSKIDHALADPSHRTAPGGFASSPDFTSLPPEDRRFEAMFSRYFESSVSRFFPYWVIGHEIGHAVLDHGQNALRYEDGRLSELSREAREAEVEADLFVIEKIDRSEAEGSFHLFQMLTHLLNHWVAANTGTTAIELGERTYTGPRVLIIDDSWVHPQMIIRILNMLDAYLRKFPDMDSTGYYSRVRSQLRIVRKG